MINLSISLNHTNSMSKQKKKNGSNNIDPYQQWTYKVCCNFDTVNEIFVYMSNVYKIK